MRGAALRRGRAAAACAVGALAAILSVQQGEHGPLVVYKLQLNPGAAQAVPPAPPGTVVVIPSRAPRVLGTVAIPADGAAAPLPAAPGPAAVEAVAPAAPAAGATVSGNAFTLEEVSNELTWRRETAEKLREVSFAPRF